MFFEVLFQDRHHHVPDFVHSVVVFLHDAVRFCFFIPSVKPEFADGVLAALMDFELPGRDHLSRCLYAGQYIIHSPANFELMVLLYGGNKSVRRRVYNQAFYIPPAREALDL